MEGMANYKCNACGGNIAFNPTTQKLVCEHCRAEYLNLNKDKKTQVSSDNYNNYDCLSCGAKLVADKLTIATECAFCGSNVVLSDKSNTHTQPEYILPFAITKEKAMGLFRELCKKEKLAPREITKQSKISRMQGVYVPAWFLNIQYKKKKYCFTINGQTGKIAGVLPMSNIARKIIHILMSALVIAVLTGLSLFTGPLSAAIVFAATVFFSVQSYRTKKLVDDSVYYLDGQVNSDIYIVDNSINVSESSTTFIREEEIIEKE